MKSVLITSSILILLVAALRPILRGRIDPRMQYALWLIAALRLLAPVELAPSAYSALALLDRAGEPSRIVEAIGQASVPAQSYGSARTQVLEEYRRRGIGEADLTPGDLMDIDTRARELTQGPTLSELAGKYARPVWLGGAAVAAAWFLLVNLRLRRKLGRAELLQVEPSAKLPVFLSDALPSPCLCGTLRPAVYVTPAAAEDPDRMRHVLAHEVTHYRHRDHWWALVRCLCLCLYWFDPLVWWAAALSRQDCELACDAGAIRRLGEEERIPYGRTLVDMIAAGRTPLLQTATTMTGGRRRVRERVKLIARKPKTVLALTLAAALLLALAVGCTFTGAPEGSPDPSPLSSDALNTATLPSRLLDVPEELYAEVDALSGGTDATALAQYWMHRSWTDHPTGMGWLLTVYQWNQEQFERYYPDLEVTGGVHCFAKDDSFYYVIFRATDARAPMSETGYMDAFEAVRAYAMEQVLATEGVESFTPDSQSAPDPAMPSYIDGLDYTLVTSYEDVPEDPEQWYLVGQLPDQPLWMFTRNRGAETMFQIDGELTQVFPHRACYYGGPQTHDGRAPQLMRLWGGGNGKGTYDGAFAVITHLFQGGTDQMYQLTVYNLDADPVTAYVHDMEPLMEDFNQNFTSEVHRDRRAVSLSYAGQTTEITFHEGDAVWDSISEYGFTGVVWDTCYSYSFNDDGTANLIMPIDGPMVYSACWTLRFTGSGFETTGFRFVQSDDVYTYISTVH